MLSSGPAFDDGNCYLRWKRYRRPGTRYQGRQHRYRYHYLDRHCIFVERILAAAGAYGARALEVATTIKLTRALWIIPITLFFGFRYKSHSKNLTFPWFILGFMAVSLIFTFADVPKEIKVNITHLAKIGFALTLFLIGLTFDLRKIRQVGMRPLFFGVSLWPIVSTLSLWFIIY